MEVRAVAVPQVAMYLLVCAENAVLSFLRGSHGDCVVVVCRRALTSRTGGSACGIPLLPTGGSGRVFCYS